MTARRWRWVAMRGSALAGLLGLSFLGSLRTLRFDLMPFLARDLLPRMEGQALALGMLALTAAAISGARRERWPRGGAILRPVWIGLWLFVAPGWLTYLAKGWVPGSTVAALLSLTPVFAVAIEPYAGRADVPPMRGGLLAALAAVAGTLFVFPISFTDSVEAGVRFCAVILAAASVAVGNCWAVAWVEGQESEVSEASQAGVAVWPMAAIAGATGAVGLELASRAMEQTVWSWERVWPELVWFAVVELPALLLLFWLMPRMTAVRMTTRYVLGLLLPVLIEAAVLRAELSLRTWLGLGVMAAGVGWLLLADKAEMDGSSLQ